MPIAVAQAVPYAQAMPMAPAVAVVDPHHVAMAAMQAQINALMAERAQGGRVRAEDSDEELEPFAPFITSTPFPQGFKVPHLSTYDGTTDPTSHLSTFNVMMRASNVNSELRCMLFPTTLTRPAKSWFDKFRRHSITSWDQLSADFRKQFRNARTLKPEASSLANIKQRKDETLKNYLARFSLAAAQTGASMMEAT